MMYENQDLYPASGLRIKGRANPPLALEVAMQDICCTNTKQHTNDGEERREKRDKEKKRKFRARHKVTTTFRKEDYEWSSVTKLYCTVYLHTNTVITRTTAFGHAGTKTR